MNITSLFYIAHEFHQNEYFSFILGETELVEFLTEEILAEKKAQKAHEIPRELDGFKVKLDRSEVELLKQNDKEKIVISFNINHTVDSEDEPEVEDDGQGKAQLGEMKSKPNFEIDIVRGKKTLSFTCSFLQGAPAEGEYSKNDFNEI